MRKKRFMVVGPNNSGKARLVNKLNDDEGKIKSSQDIIYGKNTIYIPGSYIESPWMHKHIITMAQDASHILILVDQSKTRKIYPPGFAKSFTCPVIGLISRADEKKENKDSSIRQLKDLMVLEPYFEISRSGEEGIEKLKNYLFSKKE